MKLHSHIGTAAYTDLLRLKQDEGVAAIRGSIRRIRRGSRTYIYDEYRMGARRIQKYIGEETDELTERLKKIEAIKENEAGRRKRATELVRVLRAEGYASLDATSGSFLMNLARIGVFRLGGTVVGTIAFRLYEGELGLRLESDLLAQTGDLDIASFEKLSLALGDQVEEAVTDVLKELSFEPVPSIERGHVWKWAESRGEALVEFLTPGSGDEGLRDLPALGVSAQALHHLNFLIARPIKAVALYRSGVLLQVPRPEAFTIHKLIVADRRRGTEELKSRKDRAQAATLIEAMAELRPDELAEAYEDAMERGPKWRERIGASLARMPESAAILKGLAG